MILDSLNLLPPSDLYLWIETLELEISVKHREVLKHNFSTIHYLARDIRRYTPPCHLCKTFGYHLKKISKDSEPGKLFFEE